MVVNVFPEIVRVQCAWFELTGIQKWCVDNGIEAVFRNHWTEETGVGVASFEIIDESQRVFFILRWA